MSKILLVVTTNRTVEVHEEKLQKLIPVGDEKCKGWSLMSSIYRRFVFYDSLDFYVPLLCTTDKLLPAECRSNFHDGVTLCVLCTGLFCSPMLIETIWPCVPINTSLLTQPTKFPTPTSSYCSTSLRIRPNRLK